MDIKTLSWVEIKNLAKKEGINIFGKKKSELIKELEDHYAGMKAQDLPVAPELEKNPVQVEVKKSKGSKVFKSMDGRQLEVSINKEYWKGTTIIVPEEYADDVSRLLTDGHYIFMEVNSA